MAAPILKIPVDDEAFNKFLSAFAKYQASLGEQSEVWSDVNSNIKDLAESSADFVKSIEDQISATQKLTEYEDRRDRLLREAAARRKKEQEEEKKREDELAAKRKKTINSIRDYGKTISDVAMSLGKIGTSPNSALGLISGASEGLGAAGDAAAAAGGGGLMAGLGGAAALGAGALAVVGAAGYATYELADRQADLQRRAGGLGISTGELQGSHIYQNRLVDTESAMDRIMRMKYDVTQRAPLYTMGINPQGKDPSQLLTEISLNAKRMIEKNPESFLTNAHAYGYDKVLSAEDLMRIKGSSREEIVKYGKDAADFAKLHGNTQEQNKSLTDFKNNVDAVSTAFTNDLVPAADAVATSFNRLVKAMDEQRGGAASDQAKAATGDVGAATFALGPVGPALAMALALGKKFGDKVHDTVYGRSGASSGSSKPITINQTESFRKEAKSFPELEAKYGLPSGMLAKIAQIESGGGRKTYNSKSGAMGAFQFMPKTAEHYGITDRNNPGQEALGAAKMFHDLLKTFNGNQTAAIAAYDEGPGAVKKQMRKYHEDWLSHAPKETQEYVRKYNSVQAGHESGSGKHVKVSLNVNNSTGNSVAITTNSAKWAALA